MTATKIGAILFNYLLFGVIIGYWLKLEKYAEPEFDVSREIVWFLAF